MSEEYNVVVIGSGPAAYMALVYTHTANLFPLFIKEVTEETLNFQGYNKVVGVLDVKDKQDLLDRARAQIDNFKIGVKESYIKEISYDNKWIITTESETIKASSIIIDDKLIFLRCFNAVDKSIYKELASKGLFVCGNMKEKYNEAIVLFASGCIASFDVKEFLGA
ncbi:hypothetical protein H312_02824 [Anncaliia algerae PRA339]|uniref:FAD/NAD(P)-binding domain-containing protein n=1 Tax=Anncaliia algerae PRA339 TaxID=1288291 RepID=A0A059EY53_9MICR|nr:hypothetical protein H312_02824 [Anncaliia algerae PRA339]